MTQPNHLPSARRSAANDEAEVHRRYLRRIQSHVAQITALYAHQDGNCSLYNQRGVGLTLIRGFLSKDLRL